MATEAVLPHSRLQHLLRWRLLSDDRLVRFATRGEERAFAAIFERYHQELYRYCRVILANEEDARDALQNTMLAVLRALPGERREIALKPWLYRIAHNESVSLLRGRGPLPPLSDAETRALVAPRSEPEVQERLRELLSDLRSLPERQRSALVMRELGDLSHEEIGASMGTSAAAARQLIYAAREALQRSSEGREMDCGSVRERLSARDRRLLAGRRVRAHLRDCASCRDFESGISERRAEFQALSPLPALAAAGLLGELLGGAKAGGGGSVLGAAAGGSAGKAIAVSALTKPLAALTATALIAASTAQLTGVVHLRAPLLDNTKGASASTLSKGQAAGSAGSVPAAVPTRSPARPAAPGHHGRAVHAHHHHGALLKDSTVPAGTLGGARHRHGAGHSRARSHGLSGHHAGSHRGSRGRRHRELPPL